MSDRFTLIAYKPDSSCICMGCVTDVYSSDFQLHVCSTLDQVAEYLSVLHTYEYGEQEAKYEIHILLNGLDVQTEVPSTIRDELRVKVEAALQRRAEEARLRAEQEALAKAAQQQQSMSEQEKRDLETFFALGKRFGYSITKQN